MRWLVFAMSNKDRAGSAIESIGWFSGQTRKEACERAANMRNGQVTAIIDAILPRALHWGNKTLEVMCFGRRFDDFSPKITNPTLAERLKPVAQAMTDGSRVVAPSLGFTTHWEDFSKDSGAWTSLDEFLWRTKPGSTDGVRLAANDKDSVIAGFNADCPFGIILWPDGRLGFCHLGLDCVLPSPKRVTEGRDPEGIFATAGLEPGCKVFVTEGIGSCCYGNNSGGFDYVFERYPQLADKLTTSGPRANQPAMDLHALVRIKLIEFGVREEDIEVATRCSACMIDEGVRPFFSNVHKDSTVVGPDGKPIDSRNCVAVRRTA